MLTSEKFFSKITLVNYTHYTITYSNFICNFQEVGLNDEEEEDDDDDEAGNDRYHELMYKAIGTSWDEVDVDETGLPPPLVLHANISSMKLDLLSSIFQGLYPTEQDCILIRKFLACPASLEEKYSMMR